MRTRVMTSLALPAALATAGLLNTAEAAYAAVAPDDHTGTATYGYQGPLPDGDVTLIPGSAHPCPPIGNVTITDYGHCCPPVGNITISDYGHCCTHIGNVTIPGFVFCRDDHDHDHDHDPYIHARKDHQHS
ncbi:hypothetical protein [Streptomyces sp. S.PNR 29]|uniref:hypothetical protein n=1 Tax=Streptomyces sp. S.PNR 29 TaxID=2973805 RepID=UPI0025AFCA6F|nr:hypothetical protein [Streptomyces sp. S.PNR 29]MDN0196696.1 hypothetical protein [Streptomyces sp. S.PNR 29]